MNAPKLNGYQVRTERTKTQLLLAAEEVFARDGFEGAQMDSIAKTAGRSKGAIYAHYKSKDDLFLALFEHRVNATRSQVFKKLQHCVTRDEVFATIKSSMTEIAKDRTWILLTMEAKLYALRHPEMRDRWLKTNQIFRSKSGLHDSDQSRVENLIVGALSSEQRSEWEARSVAFGPIIAGLVLEAEFEPKVLGKKRLTQLIDELTDALLRVPGEA